MSQEAFAARRGGQRNGRGPDLHGARVLARENGEQKPRPWLRHCQMLTGAVIQSSQTAQRRAGLGVDGPSHGGVTGGPLGGPSSHSSVDKSIDLCAQDWQEQKPEYSKKKKKRKKKLAGLGQRMGVGARGTGGRGRAVRGAGCLRGQRRKGADGPCWK